MTPFCHLLTQPKTLLQDKTDLAVNREFIRITSGSGKILNVEARGIGDKVKPDLPTGIKFQGDASDWLVQGAKMSNFAMRPIPGAYRNGDGLATELGNKRITIVGGSFHGNGDAGCDLKGPDWIVQGTDCQENAHNFRFWSRGRMKSGWSRKPKLDPMFKGKALHVHICVAVEHTEQQVIYVDKLVAEGPGTLFHVQTNGKIPPKLVFDDIRATGVDEIMTIEGPAPEVVWLRGAPRH